MRCLDDTRYQGQINERLGPCFLRAISQESIPSWIVQRAIRGHRSKPATMEGGDLTDLYLLCLAMYADWTIVDKRTWENWRRARIKEPAALGLLNGVRAPSGVRGST